MDSAGTQGYHVGEAPDPRAQKFAMQRGYDLSGLRARKLELRDFQEFDLVLGMEAPNGALRLFEPHQVPPEFTSRIEAYR